MLPIYCIITNEQREYIHNMKYYWLLKNLRIAVLLTEIRRFCLYLYETMYAAAFTVAFVFIVHHTILRLLRMAADY